MGQNNRAALRHFHGGVYTVALTIPFLPRHPDHAAVPLPSIFGNVNLSGINKSKLCNQRRKVCNMSNVPLYLKRLICIF